MRGLVAAIGLIVCLSSTCAPLQGADSGERFLRDYLNDDGSRPDGSNAARDDTSALRKALADGPGVVHIVMSCRSVGTRASISGLNRHLL